MKIKSLVLVTTTALGISITPLFNSKQAEAATWHKGTPKVLRGTWQKKVHEGGISFDTGIQIKKNYFTTFSPGDPLYLKPVSYHKVGNGTYALKGKEVIYSPHTVIHIRIKKTGNKIKYKITIPKQTLHLKKIYSTWYPKH